MNSNLAKFLMIQGTSSSVGKSILVAALCRIFRRKGISVAPFKAQNMALNSFVTRHGGEMGRSQVLQAQAAGIEPSVDMNPVLLKPEADARSQIVVRGKPWARKQAQEYYEYRDHLWGVVTESLNRLGEAYQLIIIEGAGSPAEINLKRHEIVNMRVARHLNAPVLLVGDIDRGGVFASLLGTMMLLDGEEKQLVQGFVINKFRGDVRLLEPGLDMLQQHAEGRPVFGVIPYIHDLRLAQEDSVYLDTVEPGSTEDIDIAVIRFPHISNYDDADALSLEKGVGVRFVERCEQLGDPSAIILPGTKTTLADLRWLRRKGLDAAIAAALMSGCSVVGLCGGYQILGRSIRDSQGVESEMVGRTRSGLGFLPIETEFESVKETEQVRGRLLPVEGAPWQAAGMEIEGYEIHMGRSRYLDGAVPLIELEDGRKEGAVSFGGRVWGSYIHGIFDRPDLRRAWLRSLGWQREGPGQALADVLEAELNRLADHVEANLDMDRLQEVIGL
jgi:adenosylcobyric acid synthase